MNVFASHIPTLKQRVALLLLLLLLTACSIGGNTINTPTPIGAIASCPTAQTPLPTPTLPGKREQPDGIRYWTRNVVAVAFQPNANGDVAQDQSLAQKVANLFNCVIRLPGGAVKPYTEDGLPAVIFTRHTITIFLLLPATGDDPSDDALLIEYINTLNRLIIGPETDLQNTARTLGIQGQVVGVSPDWLIGAMPTGDHIGGSPGGPPKAAIGTYTVASTPKLGTAVYVLDTAYNGSLIGSRHQLAGSCGSSSLSLQCLPSGQPFTPPNQAGGSALTSFLRDPTLLRISDLSLATDQPVNSPPYEPLSPLGRVEVRDHGVFVGSIIHQIAPGAQIHLIRVLNDYGVGNLKTLLFALQTIDLCPERLDGSAATCGSARANPHQVIINLSLGFSMPTDCLNEIWNQGGFSVACKPQLQSPNMFVDALFTRLFLPAGIPFADLTRDGYRIVAAAGNNAEESANMPAAFCATYAVAATLPGSATSLATFSNQPFVQTTTTKQACLDVTLNSSTLQVQLAAESSGSSYIQEAQGVNVCSAYLDTRFPSGIPNTDNVALWDGTSFSAAIVSGTLAETGSTNPLSLPTTCTRK